MLTLNGTRWCCCQTFLLPIPGSAFYTFCRLPALQELGVGVTLVQGFYGLPTHIAHCLCLQILFAENPGYGFFTLMSTRPSKLCESQIFRLWVYLKNVHPLENITLEKYSFLKNILPWQLVAPEKYSPMKNKSPLKNIHPWKKITPK